MAGNIQEINVILTDTRDIIQQYRIVVRGLAARTRIIESNLPRWINTFAWSATIALIWISLTQVGLILQGLALIRTDRTAEEQARSAPATQDPRPEVAPGGQVE